MLIYYIPPPRECKWYRRAFMLVPDQLWCQYQSTKHDNHNGGGNKISYAKPGAIPTRVKEWPLYSVIHVGAIDGSSKLMNEQSLIPLLLAKLEGAAVCGKSVQGSCFSAGGLINLDFLIDWEGSMMWCRRKKKLL